MRIELFEDWIRKLDIFEGFLTMSFGIVLLLLVGWLCLSEFMKNADGLSLHPILLSNSILNNSKKCQTNNSSKARGGSNSIEYKNHNNVESTVVILFNKPEKVLTSHVSEDGRSTVYEIVESMEGFVPSSSPPESGTKISTESNNDKSITFQEATGITSKLHAIGRLDADTSGLLLLTNDGGLVHHVTNRNAPTHHDNMSEHEGRKGITKTYEAVIMGHHTDESLQQLWDGVDIGSKYGGMTLPVDAMKILNHPNHKSTVVSITISEGKNRQVRRMFHAIGSGVMRLKRTIIGNHLNLDGLDIGQWRILSNDEVLRYLKWEPRQLVIPAVKYKKEKGTARGHGTGARKSRNTKLEAKKYGRTRRRRNR